MKYKKIQKKTKIPLIGKTDFKKISNRLKDNNLHIWNDNRKRNSNQ